MELRQNFLLNGSVKFQCLNLNEEDFALRNHFLFSDVSPLLKLIEYISDYRCKVKNVHHCS